MWKEGQLCEWWWVQFRVYRVGVPWTRRGRQAARYPRLHPGVWMVSWQTTAEVHGLCLHKAKYVPLKTEDIYTPSSRNTNMEGIKKERNKSERKPEKKEPWLKGHLGHGAAQYSCARGGAFFPPFPVCPGASLAEVLWHAREKRSSKPQAGSLPPGSLFPTHLRRRVLRMNKEKMFWKIKCFKLKQR